MFGLMMVVANSEILRNFTLLNKALLSLIKDSNMFIISSVFLQSVLASHSFRSKFCFLILVKLLECVPSNFDYFVFTTELKV